MSEERWFWIEGKEIHEVVDVAGEYVYVKMSCGTYYVEKSGPKSQLETIRLRALHELLDQVSKRS